MNDAEIIAWGEQFHPEVTDVALLRELYAEQQDAEDEEDANG